MKRSPRFLLYSHDALGLGHTRRNLALAAALVNFNPNAAVIVATGTDDIRVLGVPPQVEVLKLPSLRKVANGHYTGRRLDLAPGAMLTLRSELLAATVKFFQPDVMVVDQHPLGAGGELRRALEALRSTGGQAVLGLRDILDSAETVMFEWGRQALDEQIVANYDRVLVYGQREVFDPVREYGFSSHLARLVRYCGYITKPPVANHARVRLLHGSKERPIVLATAGGGEDGSELFDAFFGAAAGMPWRSIAVAGPYAPEADQLELRRRADEAGVEFHLLVEGLDDWFGQVDALICMGGYNTLVEAIPRGTPTVCLPRTVPRTEQLIRAEAFARLGLLHVIRPEELVVDRLRNEVRSALATPRFEIQKRATATLDFDGASRAAGYIYSLIEAHSAAEDRVKEVYSVAP